MSVRDKEWCSTSCADVAKIPSAKIERGSYGFQNNMKTSGIVVFLPIVSELVGKKIFTSRSDKLNVSKGGE